MIITGIFGKLINFKKLIVQEKLNEETNNILDDLDTSLTHTFFIQHKGQRRQPRNNLNLFYSRSY